MNALFASIIGIGIYSLMLAVKNFFDKREVYLQGLQEERLRAAQTEMRMQAFKIAAAENSIFVQHGYTQAMEGEKLLINTVTDEMITVVMKDKKKRWDLYCKPVKITIEEISEEELKRHKPEDTVEDINRLVKRIGKEKLNDVLDYQELP